MKNSNSSTTARGAVRKCQSLKTIHPSICAKSGTVEPREAFFCMDSLELLDFPSIIIFSDDFYSLLTIFRHLFELRLVVQYCDDICGRSILHWNIHPFWTLSSLTSLTCLHVTRWWPMDQEADSDTTITGIMISQLDQPRKVDSKRPRPFILDKFVEVRIVFYMNVYFEENVSRHKIVSLV